MKLSVSARRNPGLGFTSNIYILIKFNADGAAEESNVIQYFEEALRRSIKAEVENKVCKYKNSHKLVEKMIAAEAKAALRPGSYIRKWISIVPGVIVRPNSRRPRPRGPPLRTLAIKSQRRRT